MKCGIAPHVFLQTVCCRVEEKRDVERALNGISVIGTILMTPVVVYPSKACLPHSLYMGFDYEDVKCGIAPRCSSGPSVVGVKWSRTSRRRRMASW